MTEYGDVSGGNRAAMPLDIEALRAALTDCVLGHPIIYVPALPSTNTHALALAQEGATEGTLVTTDDQTAGRGRVNRLWVSLPGQQLSLSLVLRPRFPPHFLVMASALAVAEAIERVAGVAPEIKWPNDVLVRSRKVCGILIETSGSIAVLGMGINVNGSLAAVPELATRATTLAEVVGHPLAREALAAQAVQRLDAFYRQMQTGRAEALDEVRQAWRARLVTLGHQVTIRQGEQVREGVAEDVDANGALLLRQPDGTRSLVLWGDVE